MEKIYFGRRLAFDPLAARGSSCGRGIPTGQLVRVNLAGLHAEAVMFQAAVTDAVAHIVKQTSNQPSRVHTASETDISHGYYGLRD